MDENLDIEKADEKLMSEKDKEVKGFQVEVNKFHTEQSRITTQNKIDENNAKLKSIREENDRSAEQEARAELWRVQHAKTPIVEQVITPHTNPRVQKEKVAEPV